MKGYVMRKHSYVYEIKHLSTEKVYVGSRKLPPNLDKISEDMYMGSSSNPLFSKETIVANIDDYKKTVLKTFDTYQDAYLYENAVLIPHYKNEFKEMCVNKVVIISEGVKYITPNLGKTLPPEWRENMAKAQRGKKQSAETRRKMSEAAKKRKPRNMTDKWKKSLEENSKKGREAAKQTKVICEHCGKELVKSTYSRYHANDRCKESPNVDKAFWEKIKQNAQKAGKLNKTNRKQVNLNE